MGGGVASTKHRVGSFGDNGAIADEHRRDWAFSGSESRLSNVEHPGNNVVVLAQFRVRPTLYPVRSA
jgi:hypothetical protein